MAETLRPGLEGVVVAETVLSHADPARGMLWVRGHAIPQLVEHYGYEGTVALLWDGFAGSHLTRAGMTEILGAARRQAFAQIDPWLSAAAGRPLDEAVRIGLAMLPDTSPPAAIVATLAVCVPAALRVAAGAKPLPPDPNLPVAADVLRMLHGVAPSEAQARTLDTYFAAMAESGMGPATFTARTVASTRASLVAAVLAAWCSFTGPLHGGAPGPTLDMLDAAAAAEAAGDLDAWIERKLTSGERLAGFGHRVFRGNDPRATALRAALQRMEPSASRLKFVAHLEHRVAAIVARVKPGRQLPANVEVMAALLLDAVGIPRQAFTAVFAITRCAGWIAHALEQQQTGRMIRPASEYVGPKVE
ncbi:MAG TPA: citrate/2-methylcitrate synthase [Xanthobacteraceae bacterium]|jgi:citrate synthase|nr:citrate/2-methylcitrate synthase [Xanthobacteraceae bacterium]